MYISLSVLFFRSLKFGSGNYDLKLNPMFAVKVLLWRFLHPSSTLSNQQQPTVSSWIFHRRSPASINLHFRNPLTTGFLARLNEVVVKAHRYFKSAVAVVLSARWFGNKYRKGVRLTQESTEQSRCLFFPFYLSIFFSVTALVLMA